MEEFRLEYPPHYSYPCRLGARPSYILYQYILSFRKIPVHQIVFSPVFRRVEVTSLEVKYVRFGNGDERTLQKPLIILSCKRSLIRTSQVCHRRLAVGRSQQVKEYKHTHTHTHTHTLTNVTCSCALVLLKSIDQILRQSTINHVTIIDF